MIKQRIYWLLLLICFSVSSYSQQLIDREGVTTFFSSAPLEDIEAKNSASMAVLDLDAGQVAVSMYMTDFEFDNSLMQQHFNENYVESEKYPKATFSGSLEAFDPKVVRSNGEVSYTVTGEITIHGVTKPLEAVVNLKTVNGNIVASTDFRVKTADFKIKIPKLLFKNIAEDIDVSSRFQFNLNNHEEE